MKTAKIKKECKEEKNCYLKVTRTIHTEKKKKERDCEINDEWFSNEKSGKRN